MTNKQKHLEFIQAIVTRMGNNLFMLKGWTITLIVGLFTFMFKDSNDLCFIFSICIILIFWILDGYFLSTERCYRALYDEVRLIKDDKKIDYSLKAEHYRKNKNSWLNSMFSKTLNIFYIPLLILILFGFFYSNINKIDIYWKNDTFINQKENTFRNENFYYLFKQY
ncbi:MAG: hypothetical protein PHD49_00090 [Candidatus Shapirobacteria bacterium]|nr:hypothetical protein [Candidatus Shapirobacteria bacterium]MDD4382538.1 hypothetical protein [Candidatus Shapirobacteria bacterium]